MWIDLMEAISLTDIEGVLGCEYATGKHALSTYPPTTLILLSTSRVKIQNSKVLETIPVVEEDYSYCTSITKKLFITNPERTICDMIRFNREERFLYESLERYLRRNSNLSNLYSVADHYLLRNKLDKHILELPFWMADFYEN